MNWHSREEQQKSLPQRLVCIVEDDESIGLTLSLALTYETSYRSLVVTSAEKALQLLENVKPGLFILDYQLPRMNGIQFCQLLKQNPEFSALPVIMLSANLPVAAIKDLKVIGIRTPFELDELLKTIDTLLSR